MVLVSICRYGGRFLIKVDKYKYFTPSSFGVESIARNSNMHVMQLLHAVFNCNNTEKYKLLVQWSKRYFQMRLSLFYIPYWL